LSEERGLLESSFWKDENANNANKRMLADY
jgi:hypothetical protein